MVLGPRPRWSAIQGFFLQGIVCRRATFSHPPVRNGHVVISSQLFVFPVSALMRWWAGASRFPLGQDQALTRARCGGQKRPQQTFDSPAPFLLAVDVFTVPHIKLSPRKHRHAQWKACMEPILSPSGPRASALRLSNAAALDNTRGLSSILWTGHKVGMPLSIFFRTGWRRGNDDLLARFQLSVLLRRERRLGMFA